MLGSAHWLIYILYTNWRLSLHQVQLCLTGRSKWGSFLIRICSRKRQISKHFMYGVNPRKQICNLNVRVILFVVEENGNVTLQDSAYSTVKLVCCKYL
jgi:hypothetical protein